VGWRRKAFTGGTPGYSIPTANTGNPCCWWVGYWDVQTGWINATPTHPTSIIANLCWVSQGVGNGLAPFRVFVFAEGVTPCGDPGQAQGPAPTQISLPAGWRTGISHEWWQI